MERDREVKRVLFSFAPVALIVYCVSMSSVAIVLEGFSITFGEALTVALSAITALSLALLFTLASARSASRRESEAAAERQRELETRIAALAQSSAELNGRMGSLGEWLGSRQVDLARVVSERLDSVGHRLGAGLETHAKTTGENLEKLNERLAVIDAAQARLAGMTEEVVSLKDILSNKQSRGAFGQGRMEAIVRDGLPLGAYEFQVTLGNKARPDCVIRLPGDPRPLAVDAKFPLEAFTAHREARDDDARRAAGQRARADMSRHIKDIAERYLLPGETQDIALMFVPSESVYSDLVEHFDDVVQRAHRARVVIVSPSLLMMAIQVTQTILRDARMRESVHVIQAEVGKLLGDIRRLSERAGKLESHFRNAREDLGDILISTEKVKRRGERIESMEFSREPENTPPIALPRLMRGV